ncbi:Rpn family recombination-promoting nuclease/putative transposase [Sporosarcina sp. 6E9]|uniref:Rpn family recombination-promoting nuclease/putative transposase n=1 Tax=Sporosarcina sp. 6E9 TaxID=2819235 RepID=UPI0021129F4E|nr:Rpn family recombination-promoting nuclease/putative transposase [Sporosarcina sp. 6E9]
MRPWFYCRVDEPICRTNKAIQIVITNFNLLEKPHYHSMFQLIDPENGALFSSHMEIHVLELSKVKGLKLKNATKLEQWLIFMKGDKETKEALAMESLTIRDAFSEIQRLSDDTEMRKAAIAREIHLKDQIQRELDAKEEGKEENITKVILSMHRKQYPIEEIADVLNMPVENVVSIIKSTIQ